MCHESCLAFGRANLADEDARGKAVIEVGALDVNGSLRNLVEAMEPASYLGIDITPGPGVDEICDAGNLRARYGDERFDLVLCTEVVEHARDWQSVISNIKHVLRPGGVLLLTTRSHGFKYHGYPYDFWRYELSDMDAIFSDLEICVLASDPRKPGVFLKARKPGSFSEARLDGYALYSVIRRRRVSAVGARDIAWFRLKRGARRLARRGVPRRLGQRLVAQKRQKPTRYSR